MKVEIICATRKSEADFPAGTALGASLNRLAYDKRISARVHVDNTHGLPEVYNQSLISARDDSAVVFMHDDVWIDDYHFSQRITEGLAVYDVIGVAGNLVRHPGQPAWLFPDLKFTWDQPANLTGSIAHGHTPFGEVSCFGAAPQACELLDGVMLAAKKSVLMEHDVWFDTRFTFHFYDMDFCRTARRRGLKLGTWPISLTHQSTGAFGDERWRRAHRAYLEKWGG